jgi:hypothetical protein
MFIEHRFQRSPTGVCNHCQFPRKLHRWDRDGAIKRETHYRGNSIKPRDRIIGIDGEGKGRRPHVYTYIAACDEKGKTWSKTNPNGLSSVECFEFLLSLPSRALCFGFSLLYDLTKICQDLPDDKLYSLFHEDTRAKLVEGRLIYKPVRWNGYILNYANRRFSVERGTRGTVVWDIFRFFATKFTGALKDWKIADETKLTRMERMKALRSEFDKQSTQEIEAYCNEECSYLAKLGRALITAHDSAGLKLRAYHGAGSTASAFLARIDVKERRGQIPGAMRIPVASAFFGGRFENSVVGPVGQRVYGYDISSAYPYHATFLPCLSCGRWRHSRGLPNDLGRLALIHWTRPRQKVDRTWGTLPVRLPNGWNGLSKGTIVFPLTARGGWAWRDEFLAASAIDPGLEATETWIYDTDCQHKPFADIPSVYRERIKLGKDAQGLVLKLGLNSIYGKLAQSVGLNPPFQSWVWAGNITSGCRAQLLRLMTRDTLMVATDGLWSTSQLTRPAPLPTGTNDLPKPLGGWEEKIFERGVFCVRPGIYFPMSPTEGELEAVRARGLGRRIVYEQWERIVAAFERGAPEIKLGGVQRFVGAKTGFSIAKGKVKRRPCYGEWIVQDIKCGFSARPKRVRRDGNRLVPWPWVDVESIPYDNAVSDDGLLLAIEQLIAEEQPNADYADLE